MITKASTWVWLRSSVSTCHSVSDKQLRWDLLEEPNSTRVTDLPQILMSLEGGVILSRGDTYLKPAAGERKYLVFLSTPGVCSILLGT